MSKRFLFLIAVAATFSSISGTCVGGQYTGLRLHIDPPIPPPEKRPHTPVREKGHDLSSSKKHDSKNAVKLEVASPIPACAINSQLLPYFSVSKTKGTIIWSAEPDSLKNSSGVPSDGMPREGDIAKFGAKSGKIWFDGGAQYIYYDPVKYPGYYKVVRVDVIKYALAYDVDYKYSIRKI